jgi:hypothetical protein
MKRLGSIELLRIIFTVAIVSFHCGAKKFKMLSTDLPVELFFITCGFFLYDKARGTESIKNLIRELWIKLFPCQFIVTTVVNCFQFNHDALLKPFLMLSETSIGEEFPRYGSWYVGAYFWGNCFYFALLKMYGTHGKRLFISVLPTYVAIIVTTFYTSDQTNIQFSLFGGA